MLGLFELLHEIDRRELRAAVASSGARSYVNAVLQAIGLIERFRATVSPTFPQPYNGAYG